MIARVSACISRGDGVHVSDTLSDRSPGPGEDFDGGAILSAGMGIRVTSDGDLIV